MELEPGLYVHKYTRSCCLSGHKSAVSPFAIQERGQDYVMSEGTKTFLVIKDEHENTKGVNSVMMISESAV